MHLICSPVLLHESFCFHSYQFLKSKNIWLHRLPGEAQRRPGPKCCRLAVVQSLKVMNMDQWTTNHNCAWAKYCCVYNMYMFKYVWTDLPPIYALQKYKPPWLGHDQDSNSAFLVIGAFLLDWHPSPQNITLNNKYDGRGCNSNGLAPLCQCACNQIKEAPNLRMFISYAACLLTLYEIPATSWLAQQNFPCKTKRWEPLYKQFCWWLQLDDDEGWIWSPDSSSWCE